MPKFRVLCNEAGEWAEHRDVEAQGEQQAAEQVCGGPLSSRQKKPGELRAQVNPEGTPGERKLFYAPD